jgi:hypothetical protein
MKDLLFTQELMFDFRADVYRDGLVEFYKWECNDPSYDGMICNHDHEKCIRTKLCVEKYNIIDTGTLYYLGSPNDLLMEYWSKIKSKYRDIRLNEIGIF